MVILLYNKTIPYDDCKDDNANNSFITYSNLK